MKRSSKRKGIVAKARHSWQTFNRLRVFEQFSGKSLRDSAGCEMWPKTIADKGFLSRTCCPNMLIETVFMWGVGVLKN